VASYCFYVLPPVRDAPAAFSFPRSNQNWTTEVKGVHLRSRQQRARFGTEGKQGNQDRRVFGSFVSFVAFCKQDLG
jgi:hypothetical protein